LLPNGDVQPLPTAPSPPRSRSACSVGAVSGVRLVFNIGLGVLARADAADAGLFSSACRCRQIWFMIFALVISAMRETISILHRVMHDLTPLK